MKKLGFGLMRMPTLPGGGDSDVDLEQVKAMVDLFMARGFTYFDTAIMYAGFASQSVAKKVLVDRYPRESFTLATKLHAAFFHSFADRDKIFAEQLEQTGAGYFDYYLLHGVEGNSWPKYEKFDCFSWISAKKAAGLVRHIGFSFHGTPELLDEILTKHPEAEFVQLQINYLDWDSAWVRSRACYEVAVKHDKDVIVMEPVKGGTLARVPKAAETLFAALDPAASVPSFAIRFAASLDRVTVVLSGMSSLAQVEDNTAYMERFKPLSARERETCFRVAEIINGQITVPCTGCSYCTAGCPRKIAIPQYFSLYNENMREDLAEKGWTVNFANYAALAKTHGRAKDCVACGQCERVCPQHLPIIKHLAAVSAHFDE